ncbi:MAG: asparaginase [Bacteroidetes bacterium]|nr:asparaginase [Bacteroidota bacterium]
MRKILIIYTGGTIGMIQDGHQPYLRPADFRYIMHLLPEIDKLGIEPFYHAFERPIDSSNMEPGVWMELARLIRDSYDHFHGFVILHGTDTMAYTASALSFMLENLGKPVILTGSQLPIDVIRTDARENFITALEIASQEQHRLPEVCIFFDSKVYRGNRAIKHSAEKFSAFVSPNYPPLVESGVKLQYFTDYWLRPDPGQPCQVHDSLDANVGVFKFYPGIQKSVMEALLYADGLKGLIVESYGTGNLPTFPWFIDLMRKRIQEGMLVLNITQCQAGKVQQDLYESSKQLLNIGVISGRDMTTASGLTKMMYLLGRYPDQPHEVARLLGEDLRGEMTTYAIHYLASN